MSSHPPSPRQPADGRSARQDHDLLAAELVTRTEQLRVAEQTLAQSAYELTENIPVGTYTIELNDINIMLTSHERSDAMLLRTQDIFERLYAESAHGARIMAFGVHPYISGATHRIRYFEMMLEFLAKQPGVMFWNGSEIANWFQKASPLPAP